MRVSQRISRIDNKYTTLHHLKKKSVRTNRRIKKSPMCKNGISD